MVNKSDGFTLIELLITVAIIGILAAISVPLYMGQQKKAAFSEAQTNLQNLRLLEEQFFADRARYCPDADGDLTTDEDAVAEYKDGTDTINAATCINGRFRPGNARDLKYDYVVYIPARILTRGTCNSAGNDPAAPAVGTAGRSFTACAMPKAGIVQGTAPFWINDRNQSNIQ